MGEDKPTLDQPQLTYPMWARLLLGAIVGFFVVGYLIAHLVPLDEGSSLFLYLAAGPMYGASMAYLLFHFEKAEGGILRSKWVRFTAASGLSGGFVGALIADFQILSNFSTVYGALVGLVFGGFLYLFLNPTAFP